MPRTIHEQSNTASADAPTLLAPGRPTLDYAGLRGQCRRTVAALNARSTGRGGREGFAAEGPVSGGIPGKAVFVKEIPKGATGKLLRMGLAGKPGPGE